MNQVEIKRRMIQLAAGMLGLINIWILGVKVGNNGIAYLAVAWETFLVVWVLTGGKVPDVLGRMLRSKYAKGQYKNASKLRRNVMFLQGITGLIATILLMGMAELLAAKIFKIPYSRFLIVLLAPAIFLKTISAVLLGYFQGEGSELPTAVTSVLRQILFLGFSLLFCSMLRGYGEKVSALLGDSSFTAMYGGIGIVVAVLVTELLLLLFLILAYKGSRHSVHKRDTEGMKVTDTFIGHIRYLYRNISGKILLGLLESLPLWMGFVLYQKSAANVDTAAISYGVYFGNYLVICGLPILAVCIMLTGIRSNIMNRVRKEEHRYAKECFQSGLRIGVIHSLFFTVFIAIMSSQIAGILGGDSVASLAKMLSGGSILILGASLVYFFTGLLLFSGKSYLVYTCAGVGDLLFIISLLLLIRGESEGILALIYAGVLGVVINAVLAGILICRLLHTGIDWLRTIAVPAGSVCLTGLLCIFLSKLFTPHLGNLVTVIVCLILGSMLYWAVLLLLRCFREEELEYIPGGKLIYHIGQLMRVF